MGDKKDALSMQAVGILVCMVSIGFADTSSVPGAIFGAALLIAGTLRGSQD